MKLTGVKSYFDEETWSTSFSLADSSFSNPLYTVETGKISKGTFDGSDSKDYYQLSLNGGETITTPNDPIVHWDIARLRQNPTSRWTKDQSCTNFQIGPLKWGCSHVVGQTLSADPEITDADGYFASSVVYKWTRYV